MGKDYFFKAEQVAIFRPTGTLDGDKIKEFITFLNEISEHRDPHFHRFIDLSRISGISVKYQDVHLIAKQRKEFHSSHLKRKIKMAFLATNPLTFGMARMYQTISNDPLIEINICNNLEEVSKYLDIDISIINP